MQIHHPNQLSISVFISTRDIELLNLDCHNSINALNKWFVANRLQVHLDKTNIMVFPNDKASDIHVSLCGVQTVNAKL